MTGCPRVRASSHFQIGSSGYRWSSWTWNLLYYPLYRHLLQSWPANGFVWCSTSGSKQFTCPFLSHILSFSLMDVPFSHCVVVFSCFLHFVSLSIFLSFSVFTASFVEHGLAKIDVNDSVVTVLVVFSNKEKELVWDCKSVSMWVCEYVSVWVCE